MDFEVTTSSLTASARARHQLAAELSGARISIPSIDTGPVFAELPAQLAKLAEGTTSLYSELGDITEGLANRLDGIAANYAANEAAQARRSAQFFSEE